MTDYTPYIKTAQVFANMTFLEVYLFDFAERKLVFASPTMLQHREIQSKEVSDEGRKMDIDKVFPMSQDELTALSAAALKYKELSPERQKNFVVRFNTRPSRNVMAETHRLSIVTTDEHNNPILVMGIVSPSLHGGAETMVAHVATEDFIYRYIYGSGEWVCEPLPHLSDNELTMLRLSLQGYSLENIGQLMYKSTESVKYYRRQVYQKLGANNIAEALGIAADYCLL